MGVICLTATTVVIVVLASSASGASTPESRLLAHLFADYNPRARPVRDPGHVVHVNVSFTLFRLESIAEKTQMMTAFGGMAVKWYDELLVWDPADHGGITKLVLPQADIWLPELTAKNSVGDVSETAFVTNFRAQVFYNGAVLWGPAFKWETSCRLDLTSFPFDSHTCNISYMNYQYGGDQVLLRTLPAEDVDISQFEPNAVWDLAAVSKGSSVTAVPFGGIVFKLSEAWMTVKVSRNPTFFIWNILLPASLIGVASVLVFLLHPESGEKIGYSITMLLSYSVIMLMLTDLTPASSDLPLMTKFLVVGMLLCGLYTGLTIAVLRLYHTNPKHKVGPVMRKVVLEGLAFLVCMRKDSNKITVVKPMRQDGTVITDVERTEKEMFQDCVAGKELMNYMSQKPADDKGEEEEAASREDWHRAAHVIDRFCLLLFSVTSFVTYISLFLLIIPL